MKINMKKLAAWMLALLLVFQMIPAMAADQEASEGYSLRDATFREQLEITAEPDILTEGNTVTLGYTEGYQNLTWNSNNPEVATVENGVVTAVAPGTAKITAQEGEFSDSITIRVIASSEETAEGKDKQDSDSAGKMLIAITTAKDKVDYDGQEHQVLFTAKAIKNGDGFDASKVKINPDKIIAVKNCGITKVEYAPADFTYEGSDNVEFEVSDGWIQIKPVEVTVKADDKVKISDANPQFTATVTGMVNEEDPSLIKYEFEVSGQNIMPYGEETQGNYKVKYLAGNLTGGTSSTLYNIAEIGSNNWYRLRRTTITTEKPIEEYIKGKGTGVNVDVPTSEYYTEPYDFADEIITYNKKTYAHISRADDGLDVQGYYIATLKDSQQLVAVKGRIGGGKGCITTDQFSEEGIDSFHRNYSITIINNPAAYKTQDVYNMVSVNGSQNYHRLKRTTILAKPAEEQKKEATLNASDYVLDRYDFTNVTITIDGETYKYSPTKPTGLYDSCYTVQFENVKYQDRINGNDSWYNNDDGWLDGSRYQYGDYGENLPRTTVGFHANYKATTYKGTKPPKSVKIHSTWPSGKLAFDGAQITLKGEVEGFDHGYTLQWQYSSDKEKWIDIPGANELDYTYTLTDETENLYWRLVAED